MADRAADEHAFLDLAKARDVDKVCQSVEIDPTLVDTSIDGRRTALHEAANAEDLQAVQRLLELRAEATAQNRDGYTAQELAEGIGDAATAEALQASQLAAAPPSPVVAGGVAGLGEPLLGAGPRPTVEECREQPRDGDHWRDGDRIPTWAYDKESNELWCSLIRTYPEDEGIWNYFVYQCSPPAWRIIFACMCIIWGAFVVLPFVVLSVADCAGIGFATIPLCSLGALVAVIVMAMLCLEVHAFGFILPGIVGHLNYRTLFGIPVRFKVWFFFYLAVSAASHASLFSTSVFVGRTWKTAQCEQSTLDSIWKNVVAQSMTPFLPGLPMLALISWSLMLLQPLFGLCCGFPMNVDNHSNGDPFEHPEAERWTAQELLKCKKPLAKDEFDAGFGKCIYGWCTGRQAPIYGIYALADSSRKGLITARSHAWLLNTNAKSLDRPGSRLMMLGSIKRQSLRVGIFLLLDGCVQMKLQATTVSIIKGATSSVDGFTVFSLALAVLMAIYNLFRTDWEVIQTVKTLWPFIHKESDDPYVPWDPKKAVREVYMSLALLATSSLVCFATILYTTDQLYHSIWVCKYGGWNLEGCAELSNMTSPTATGV